jgi:N-acetyl-anhydromuramyl-L-alanine amidase AmpD
MIPGKDDVHQLHCCIHSQTWNAYLPFCTSLYWSTMRPTEQWLNSHSKTVSSHYLLKNIMFKHGKPVSFSESFAV